MENKNCLDCLYANYNHTALVLQEFTHEELRKCEHPNSAYFDQFVSTEICRLFLDEKEDEFSHRFLTIRN